MAGLCPSGRKAGAELCGAEHHTSHAGSLWSLYQEHTCCVPFPVVTPVPSQDFGSCCTWVPFKVYRKAQLSLSAAVVLMGVIIMQVIPESLLPETT